MKATVFVDVVDAWSYVGSVRFERAAAMYTILTGEAVEIGYRACRVPGSPPAEEVVAAARISAIELNVEEIVPADSTDAWRLLTWAMESGEAVQRELLHQLWRAHFLEGADITDPFILASRAALAGLDLEAADGLLASNEYAEDVERQRETAAHLGVDTTPFIVVNASRTIAGGHSQDDYLQALHRIAHGVD